MGPISTAGWVAARSPDAIYCDDEAGVYAIADGIGSGMPSEAASRIFCETMRSYRTQFSEALSQTGDERTARTTALALMAQAFNRAAERIYRLAQRKAGYGGMATSGVVLAVGPTGAVVGHVGDSRAYLMRGGELRPLTTDHTFGDSDKLDEHGLPERMTPSRTVGQMPTVQPDILWLEIDEGDAIPLCGFGLYRAFDDNELLGLLQVGLDHTIRSLRDKSGSGEGKYRETGMLVRLASPTHQRGELDTRSIIECVRRVQLFRYLTDQELIRLLKIVYQRRLQAGEVLCQEGETGDTLYVVYSGSLDVSKSRQHLITLQSGTHLGEVAFIDGGVRSASVTALERTTVLTFSREDFGTLGKNDPVLSAKVLWAVSLQLGSRLRDLTLRFADAAKG